MTRCCAPQDAGAAVSSAVLPGLGRVFRVEAVLAAPLGWLHHQLFEELEQMPRWNPTLSRVEVGRHVWPWPTSHGGGKRLQTELSGPTGAAAPG